MPPYLRLVRPGNVAMSAGAVVIGSIVAVGSEGLGVLPGGSVAVPTAVGLGWAALAAALFAGAGNVLNDYFDRETDKVNHPDRPIPSGRVSPTEARRLAVVLFVGSFVALLPTLSPPLVAIWVTNVVAMVSYERTFKERGLGGNVLIAYLVGSLFLFGGVAAAPHLPWGPVLRTGVLALLASTATLGREIVKDIEDVAGDTDRVTLPMRIGVGRAGAVAAVAYGSGIALSALPSLGQLLGPGYLVVVVADGMFIYAALVSTRRPAASRTVAKYAMLAALLAFLLGGLT